MKIQLPVVCVLMALLTTACVAPQQANSGRTMSPLATNVATNTLTSLATTAISPNATPDQYKQAVLSGATAGLVNTMTENTNNSVGHVAGSALAGLATTAVQGATAEQMKQAAISGALSGLINTTLNTISRPAPATQNTQPVQVQPVQQPTQNTQSIFQPVQ